MATLQVNGVTYAYAISEPVLGTAQQPPLLLLHGFTGSSANWQQQVQALAPHCQTITVDLIGHGQTSAPTDPTRYTMAATAADLASLLAAVVPGPVNLLGYSMGGRLALYFAVTYGHLVGKLILESASPGLATADERQARKVSDEQLADRIEAQGIGAFVEEWEALPLFASQRVLPTTLQQQLRDLRLRNNPQGLANSLRGMGTGVQPSLWSQLPTLTMPTLLLAGTLDPKFCTIAQQMAQELPNATLTIVPDAGHTIHLEQPVLFQQQVAQFLT